MSSPYRDIDIRRVNIEVAAGTTDAELWPAEPGMRCRVVALNALTSAATAFDINSKPPSAAGTTISGTLVGETGVPVTLPFNPHGWFQSEVGEGLSITTGAGQTTCFNVTVVVFADTATLLDFVYEDESEVLLES